MSRSDDLARLHADLELGRWVRMRGHALVIAASAGDPQLARDLAAALGIDLEQWRAAVLAELARRRAAKEPGQ